MKTMSLEALIADIPNRPCPVAIFCSPITGEQLATECRLADASEATLLRALGLPIYLDPTMPPTAFEVGYSAEEVRNRVDLIRERARNVSIQ